MENKRAFRSAESIQAQAITRAHVRPFLESRGFTILEDERPRSGQEHIVTAKGPDGKTLKMRVRCCWTWYKIPHADRKISATQLTAGNKGGWSATFARLLASQVKAGVSHFLLVQGDETSILSAVLVPIQDLEPLWEKQRAVFEMEWKAGNIKAKANSVENGDSPTLWLKDERGTGRSAVTDAFWSWPTLIDLTKLPAKFGPQELTPEQIAEELAKLARTATLDGEKAPRNPDWTRDELILALELYLREPSAQGSKTHPACVELSDLLNRLPIHTGQPRSITFRNPNGVGMKLSNFLRYDPTYTGKGLPSGSNAEEEVWNTFAHDQRKLTTAADAIRAGAQFLIDQGLVAVDEDEGAEEGRILTRLHKLRERRPELAKKKKSQVLVSTGALKCEVCEFDFKIEYGSLGEGFAECHHGKPISEIESGTKTMLKDLHIVCANCHRMLHRGKEWPSVDALRQLVQSKGS